LSFEKRPTLLDCCDRGNISEFQIKIILILLYKIKIIEEEKNYEFRPRVNFGAAKRLGAASIEL